MTMPTIHKILATTALCLAALGVSCCVGICSQSTFSGNGGAGETTGAAWLYIDEVSTSEDVYEDGATFVVEEMSARFVCAGGSKMLKIHNYNPARMGNFRVGQCFLLSNPKKLEKHHADGVILIDEILQLCPIEIEKQTNP
jgi:hypothetical protein